MQVNNLNKYMLMSLSFNESLNFDVIQGQYQTDKRVRIENVLSPAVARGVAENLTKLSYPNAYVSDGKNFMISHHDIQAMSTSVRLQFFKTLYSQAAQGVGFFYGRQELLAGKSSLVNNVLSWLNSAEVLQQVKLITGNTDIDHASAQATQYIPGHFLTRHNDINVIEQRRIAYVLNFSQGWHPDWGGLLQFYQADGTPKDAWSPQFNSMALFDVNHVHAVTYIAPFANAARYSITGWFKAS